MVCFASRYIVFSSLCICIWLQLNIGKGSSDWQVGSGQLELCLRGDSHSLCYSRSKQLTHNGIEQMRTPLTWLSFWSGLLWLPRHLHTVWNMSWAITIGIRVADVRYKQLHPMMINECTVGQVFLSLSSTYANF